MNQYLKKNRVLLLITSIFCLFSALGSALVPIFLQKIMDAALNSSDIFFATILHSIIFFSIVAVIVFFYSFFSKRIICRILQNIRSHLFNGFISDTIEHFQLHSSVEYLSYFVNDIKILEDNYFNGLINVIENSILFIASLSIMIYYSPTIAIFTCIAILIMLILPNLIGIPLQKSQELYSSELANLTSKLKEIFSGFEIVKTYNIEKYVRKKFDSCNNSLSQSKQHVDKLFSFTETLSLFLALLMQITVISLAAFFVMQGEITAGSLLALTQISSSLANPLVIIIENLAKINSTKEITKKITAVTSISAKSLNTQRCTYQIPDTDRKSSLCIGHFCLQTYQIFHPLYFKLCIILNGDDPFITRNII